MAFAVFHLTLLTEISDAKGELMDRAKFDLSDVQFPGRLPFRQFDFPRWISTDSI
jgi:hypothetical protein